jgi:hypothetical protein
MHMHVLYQAFHDCIIRAQELYFLDAFVASHCLSIIVQLPQSDFLVSTCSIVS